MDVRLPCNCRAFLVYSYILPLPAERPQYAISRLKFFDGIASVTELTVDVINPISSSGSFIFHFLDLHEQGRCAPALFAKAYQRSRCQQITDRHSATPRNGIFTRFSLRAEIN